MSANILTHSKIRVTGVTRVTFYAKRPNSLAFEPVTRLRDCLDTPCNAALVCNAKLSPRLLQATVQGALLQPNSRWLRLQNEGRGIERYTLRDLGDD